MNGEVTPTVTHAVKNDAESPRTRGRSGAPLETIIVDRPRCPKCEGHRLLRYRSLRDQGDGSALWWVECQNDSCRHRFKVLLE
jgi:hypothetical protein